MEGQVTRTENSDAHQAIMIEKSKLSLLSTVLSVSGLLAALCGCMSDTRHLSFVSIEYDSWAQTDTLTYTIAPMVGEDRSGIFLLLHTEGYEYGNIAFDITIKQDTTLLYREQRSYLLESNRPHKGIGNRCDYTLPVGNFTLCDTLPTTITLTSQLDPPILTGIREVGIRIAAPMREPGEPVWRVDW